MELIDTHSHLYLPEFDSDRDEAIKRALTNGIKKILLPNIDSGSILPMMQMCSSYTEICNPMMGLHPGSVKDNFNEELKIIQDTLDRNEFVGIGEIGIDLYWDKSFKKQQEEAFEIQIQWAKQKKIPVVIHSRESFGEIFNIIDRYVDSDLRGVFHSFTGNEDQVKTVNEYGFYFGINGIVTFKNSGLVKVMENIPVEKVLLETDSPYLSPVPKRGMRNESSYLVHIANRVAQIYGMPVEKLALITGRNAEKLFNLKK
jgi:TatD DNase family protein